MNRATVHVLRGRIKACAEGPTDGFDITGACGLEDLGVLPETSGDVIDVRLQCAPALEAVVFGDCQLRPVQLRCWVAGAELSEPLPGGLFKPIDSQLGTKSLRHVTPSFVAPGDRSSRARKKETFSFVLKVGSTLYAVRRSPARPASTYLRHGATSIRCSIRARLGSAPISQDYGGAMHVVS